MNTLSKAERLEIIRNIIVTKRVSNQEELAQLLNMQGIAIAQATLSRCLKTLQVMKTADEDGYYYALPDTAKKKQPLESFSFAGIEKVTFSGQMCVIKTQIGFANGIAALIDSAHIYNAMGTIAGDDTILLICKVNTKPIEIIRALEKIFPGVSSKTSLE